MPGARRVAREWALKVLYQMDVGKAHPDDALANALERLRIEFVRKAAPKRGEPPLGETCVDYVTTKLAPLVTALDPSAHRPAALLTARVLLEVPSWQEARLDKAIRDAGPAIRPAARRTRPPPPAAETVRAAIDEAMESQGVPVEVSPEDRDRLDAFLQHSRRDLPIVLNKELNRAARNAARAIVSESPLLSGADRPNGTLNTRRAEAVTGFREVWERVAAVARKQVFDWLRVTRFTRLLVDGVRDHMPAIDAALAKVSSGWRLDRQVAVDRNVLRLAACEVLYMPSVPVASSINEAVEMAKKYSTAESGRFVSGVLGALAAAAPARADQGSPAGDTGGERESDIESCDEADIE